jgi:hypothetical protein
MNGGAVITQGEQVSAPPGGDARTNGERQSARSLEAECTRRAAGHRVTHLFWLLLGRISGVLALGLAAAVATEVFSKAAADWAGYLALFAAACTAFNTALEPLTLAERHRAAGIGFKRLGRRYDDLYRESSLPGANDDELAETRAKLDRQLEALEDQSPEIGLTAAQLAKRTN